MEPICDCIVPPRQMIEKMHKQDIAISYVLLEWARQGPFYLDMHQVSQENEMLYYVMFKNIINVAIIDSQTCGVPQNGFTSQMELTNHLYPTFKKNLKNILEHDIITCYIYILGEGKRTIPITRCRTLEIECQRWKQIRKSRGVKGELFESKFYNPNVLIILCNYVLHEWFQH